ncbi:NfeD family protein [Alkalithermobacter thermoalcaliphilus]|uniref:NfeD family protein n=1 Tax=Clostridium paradoxum TaxID=29346 RepID=UPI000824F1ED
MKRVFVFLIFLTTVLSVLFNPFITSSVFSKSNKSVYVINIKGEINPGTYYYVKNSIQKAEIENANLILFEIDTMGGRVDSAVNISDVIVSTKIPTVAYINKKAESAGVLISISCDKIYMAQGATIGSAETIPYTEKNISYWTSQLRSVAQQKGRDDDIVAAMADRDIQIEGIIDKGKLLNLTTKQAKKINFIDGVANSRYEIYSDIKIENLNEVVLEKSLFDSFVDFINSTYIAPILLALGFIGLIVEVITPGFGVGGVVSILGFGLFFGGSVLGGSASAFVFFVFFIGIAFLLLEALAPGFGVFGMFGILTIVISIVMASNSLAQALIYIVISMVLTILATIFLIKKLPKRKISKTLLLDTKLNKEEGFIPYKEKKEYIGKIGVSISDLRPSGKIRVDDEILDAISESSYIERGRAVQIIQINGNKIIVREIREG